MTNHDNPTPTDAKPKVPLSIKHLKQIASGRESGFTPTSPQWPWSKLSSPHSGSSSSRNVSPPPNSISGKGVASSIGLEQIDEMRTNIEALPQARKRGRIDISDAALAMAIDCSGSTEGKVLTAEKLAAKDITALLSSAAMNRSSLLPWSHKADSLLSLDEMDDLMSSGGTNPTVLISDKHCRKALLASDLWVLLTDGYIEDNLVEKFALDIGHVGIHGTAAIIILFGQSIMRPLDSNVTVGKSVFAVTADCLLLFHDLNDIYHDRLDESAADHIMGNDDDLKTILLTASARGRKSEIRNWIQQRKVSATDPITMARPDGLAFSHMTMLLEAIQHGQAEDAFKIDLHHKLGEAHDRNWSTFASLFQTQSEKAEIRNVVCHDASTRIKTWSGTSSPQCITPISPGGGVVSHVGYAVPGSRTRASVEVPDLDVLYTPGYRLRRKLRKEQADIRPQNTCLGPCSLCKRSNQVLALLLKKPEAVIPTPNFPGPGEGARSKFPFVLGSFPDIDIVSSEVYCEACSCLIVRHGRSPKAEMITGALPLVSIDGTSAQINGASWKKTLDTAFDGRFDESIVLTVFLSLLYGLIEDLSADDVGPAEEVIEAAQWVCAALIKGIVISRSIASTPIGESPGLVSSRLILEAGSLEEVLPEMIADTRKDDHHMLLEYPMDGFIPLMLAAKSIDNETCCRSILGNVAWLRLLYLITQSVLALKIRDDVRAAEEQLTTILQAKDDEGNSDMKGSLNINISLAAIIDGRFLTAADLDNFRRLGNIFSPIESKNGAAMAVFLHHLRAEILRFDIPSVCFKTLRQQKSLRKVFISPQDVDQAQAATLIAKLNEVGM